MSKKTLITGTLILTLANFITRILGFIFRVYMVDIMGAEGIGLYQLIFPIYMLTWATCSAGVSVAVSKKVAEYSTNKLYQDSIRTLKCAIAIAVTTSIPISFLLFTFSSPIAVHIVHAPATALSLKLLGFCLPFMATACCIRGYFQGRQEMAIPATAQVIEQCARMIAIAVLSGYFVPYGLEFACALATVGLCVGELTSCLFTVIMYNIKKSRMTLGKATIPYPELFSSLFFLSLPITANRFLTSALQSIEHILIPLQLQKFGLDAGQAVSVFGMFTGMAMPLLQFPTMLTGSLSVALIPAISSARAKNNTKVLQQTVSMAIQFSSLIGIGAAGLFLSLGEEIAVATYKMEDVGYILKLLGVICPFFYLQSILTGVLNGLGLQKMTFKGNLIASVACIASILWLVPTQGLVGFTLALLLHYGIATLYHLFHALHSIELPINFIDWMIKPAFAISCGAVIMNYIHNNMLVNVFSLPIATLIAIAILGIFYITFLFSFKCICKEDLQMFLR
ncbi:polysaccharide biosynthesis protein [Candidatus Epulonipiscium fishelsonii]|uniref:Polysaccharide biosynthesis protein n=1 Tax=Candidatus Epulonipiscium fishelsonii TaxID=77094 RepID=A0ACC8XBG9_9FIRM|nr:polysaccharide biosynthesis protein [Epulopiscium sp. SCG-B11WGA-EpuloA1]ONI43441.1 polysaccharide biosynthesis protein [Epulopiscium sp. SCG-B05WGA-EpuloA1]